ncbi:unnamed protein product [Arctogadus glacialis]
MLTRQTTGGPINGLLPITLCISINQFEARLAEIVRDYAHLYDRSRRDYNDKEIVGNSWRDISVKMDGKDPNKAKWRRLRDEFIKATKRTRSGGRDDKKNKVLGLH